MTRRVDCLLCYSHNFFACSVIEPQNALLVSLCRSLNLLIIVLVSNFAENSPLWSVSKTVNGTLGGGVRGNYSFELASSGGIQGAFTN